MRLLRNEKGFTLVEVIIALAVLSIIGVAILGSLSGASKALFVADERVTAESLARSQMEYIKSANYTVAPWTYELPAISPPWDASYTLPNGYDDYSANVTAEPLHAMDDGVQKITVTIRHHDKEIITLNNYKVCR